MFCFTAKCYYITMSFLRKLHYNKSMFFYQLPSSKFTELTSVVGSLETFQTGNIQPGFYFSYVPRETLSTLKILQILDYKNLNY